MTTETIVSDRRDETTVRNDADVTIANDATVMPNVTTEEAVAHETVLADGRKLSTAGTFRNIPIDQLWRSGNPRELYDVEPLVESIRLHGFRRNEAIMVVEKVNPDNPNQKFLVVRGNRRTVAIEAIRDDFAEDFKIIFRKGCVPCVAYKGCSNREVAMLRMDFDARADKRELDGWELFLAVRILVREGIHTEATIAQILGLVTKKEDGTVVPNRSMVQPRVRLAKMPVEVQELFKPVLRGDKKATPLRVRHIQTLATTLRKCKGNANSDGFKEKLDSLLKAANPANKRPEDGDDPVVPIRYKDLQGRMNSFDSPIMRDILNVICFGEGAITLAGLDARLVRLGDGDEGSAE